MLRCSFTRLPSALWGTRDKRDWAGRQDRGLTLEKILLVGARNERKECKRKDKNERNGYLDSIHDVPANDIYFSFL